MNLASQELLDGWSAHQHDYTTTGHAAGEKGTKAVIYTGSWYLSYAGQVNIDGMLATTDFDCGDVDGDGDIDLVVGNQGPRNQLFLNPGDGTLDLVEVPNGLGENGGNTLTIVRPPDARTHAPSAHGALHHHALTWLLPLAHTAVLR